MQSPFIQSVFTDGSPFRQGAFGPSSGSGGGSGVPKRYLVNAGTLVDYSSLSAIRDSLGTFYDSGGVQQTASKNLLTYSEDVSNVIWLKEDVTIDSAVEVTGGISLDRLNITTTNDEHRIAYNLVVGNIAGDTYTLSAHVKDDGAGFAGISISETFEDFISALFDFSTETFVTDVGTTGGTIEATGFTDLGGGLYRIWVRGSTSAGGANSVYPYVYLSNQASPTFNSIGMPEYLGIEGEDVLVGGMQYEAGPLSNYAKTGATTNSAMRTDHYYNGAAWVRRGLLIEPAATNQCTDSNKFDSATTNWSYAGLTPTNNAGTASNETMTAGRMAVTAINEDHEAFHPAATPIAGSACVSGIVENDGERYVSLYVYNNPAEMFSVVFDLDTQTVTQETPVTATSITATDSGAELLKDGRVLVWATANLPVDCTYGVFALAGSATPAAARAVYLGVAGEDAFLSDFQIESGTRPTSRVPTAGSTVTRAADVIKITDLSDVGFNADEFSVLATATPRGDATSLMLLELSDNSASDRGYLIKHSSGVIQHDVVSATADTLSTASTISWVSEQEFSVAAAWKVDDFPITVDGETTVQTGTNAMPVGVTDANIGSDYAEANQWNGWIDELIYVPQRLDNTALEAYSTNNQVDFDYLHRFEDGQFYAYNAHGDDVMSNNYFKSMRTELEVGAGIIVWNDANDVTWVYVSAVVDESVTVSMGADLDGATDPGDTGNGDYDNYVPRDDTMDTGRLYVIVPKSGDDLAIAFYNGYGLNHYQTNETGVVETAHQYFNPVADAPYSFNNGDLIFSTGDAGMDGDGLHRWLFNRWDAQGYFDDFGIEYPYVDRGS